MLLDCMRRDKMQIFKESPIQATNITLQKQTMKEMKGLIFFLQLELDPTGQNVCMIVDMFSM